MMVQLGQSEQIIYLDPSIGYGWTGGTQTAAFFCWWLSTDLLIQTNQQNL